MGQLSITLDTEDKKVVEATISLLVKLSGAAMQPIEISPIKPEQELPVAPIVTPEAEVQTVPSVPEVSIPQNQVATEVDAAGTPWDERIHASTKTTVADGTWKKKRGVADEVYASVMAELTGNDQSGTLPNQNIEPTATPKVEAIETATPPPPPPPPPATPEEGKALTEAVANGEVTTFQGMMSWISQNGKAIVDVTAVAQSFGLGSFIDLKANPELIPAVIAELSGK